MKPNEKMRTVLHEFKEGELRSGSGRKVTNRRQAIAIAMAQSGRRQSKGKR